MSARVPETNPRADGEKRPSESQRESGASGGRAAAVRDWLQRRADTKLGQFALLWFRRYFEASRNSGAAATTYFFLSVLPTALAAIAFFRQAGGNENAVAQRLITHMHLNGTTADLVRQTFGTTADYVLAATVLVVIGFLFWGLGIGQLYRDVYARAWRVEAGSAVDQAIYALWFFVFSAMIGLVVVSASELRTEGWLVLVPVWLAGSTLFWLWTPRVLLHRAVPLRSLLPGALLSALVLGGTIGTSPLWIGPTVNQNANAFGSFGVVIALIGYIFICITISMVCAVFSPVWLEWRRTEGEQRAQTPTAAAPVDGSLGEGSGETGSAT